MNKNEKKAYFNKESLIFTVALSFLLGKLWKENTQAECKLYHKVIELSNMGIQTLKSHQKGEKQHNSVVSNMPCFFKSSSAKDLPVSIEESTSKVNESSSLRQQTLELNSNITFEQVFNKGKDKNIAGQPQPISRPQSTLVHCIIFPSNKDYSIIAAIAFIRICTFYVLT